MGTPLYTTDIIPMTSRPTLTVMDDGDYFVILDTSTGKISKILKTNIMTALKITYDNTSGLTAETVQAALDEIVSRFGDAETAISLLNGDVSGHIADVDNPHAVTKSQVGLGNVDNTSDLDKPISTAQQTALDGKEPSDATILKKADVVNDLSSGGIDVPLSAEQGKALKDAQDAHGDRLDTLEGTGAGSVAKAIDDAVSPLEEDITDLAGAGRTTETVKQNADDIADHETRIQVLEGFNPLRSWADIQTAVRSGVASKYLSIGDQLMAKWNGTPRVWDIIGIDHDIPTDSRFTHSLTIQANDILRGGRISGAEAMYNAVTELPAGTYIFTTNGLQYTFTSTQAVPAGGVIFIKTRSDYVPLTLTIYAADRTTIVEDNIAVTATSGTDTITPINNHERMRYGNNNYPISAIRQWLNSESATFAWQPLGLYDMPSSYETAGFINLLDADLQAVIGAVDKQVALATYDGGGQELFSDKVFLLSRVEMDLGTEGVTTGEAVYDFWSGASNADRIKGSPSSWWLRSPYVSYTSYTHVVHPSGALNDYGAYNSLGFAPACVIY